MARAARHAQAQGPAAAIRQDVDLGAEAAPAATQGVIRPLIWGMPAALTCAHTTVLSNRTADRSGSACR